MGWKRDREMPQEAQQCGAGKHSVSPFLSVSLSLSSSPFLSLSLLSRTSSYPQGNSRVGDHTARVQIIILVPCLIDARYFGLALMTAFTEFMSSCCAATSLSLFLSFLFVFLLFFRHIILYEIISVSLPVLPDWGVWTISLSFRISRDEVSYLSSSCRSWHCKGFFRFDVCSIIRSRGTGLRQVQGPYIGLMASSPLLHRDRMGRERHLLSWPRERRSVLARGISKRIIQSSDNMCPPATVGRSTRCTACDLQVQRARKK